MVNYTFSLVNLERFLLIVARILSFVAVAPFFGMTNVPARIRVGFSVIVSILIWSFVGEFEIEYTGMIGYAIIVLKEGITGLLIGYAANICNSIILFAGNITDMNIGLSMAQEFDPMMRTQVTITGNIYNYFLLTLLVVTNMHHYLLRALVDSYQVIPVNGAIFNMSHLLMSMIRFVSDIFSIASRIFLPVFICIMILNCVLGIMAKVSPQMHMFSIGAQLKILVGLTVLLLVSPLFVNVANFVFREMKQMVILMIEGMY